VKFPGNPARPVSELHSRTKTCVFYFRLAQRKDVSSLKDSKKAKPPTKKPVKP